MRGDELNLINRAKHDYRINLFNVPPFMLIVMLIFFVQYLYWRLVEW